MKRLTVGLGERSYDICVGNGLLTQLAALVRDVYIPPSIILVSDEHVFTRYGEVVLASLEKLDVPVHVFNVRPGEESKSFDTWEWLLNNMLEVKPERKTLVIALGGGVVGDLTGFAAASLLRGVPFIQVPTSLLAMVDSSVGGKTGINTQYGKNLVGAFYQPSLVVMDIDVLETLPERERRAGYAEIIKYGLIMDKPFFERMAQSPKEQGNIEQIVHSCKCKAEIVMRDERESGARALLNLGHTFGHALEAEMGYDGRLLHGEAVAVGMAMAARFSVQHCGFLESECQAVECVLREAGLPVYLRDIDKTWHEERLLGHMKQDKKVQNARLVLVLLKGIGHAFVAKDVTESNVYNFLKQEIEL